MFGIALIILVIGLLFVVRGKTVQESGKARYWIGFSLIGMTVFFLLIGISQILDISSHRIGH